MFQEAVHLIQNARIAESPKRLAAPVNGGPAKIQVNGGPAKIPCVPPGVKLTPVAGFFLDKPSTGNPINRTYPSCGGKPSLADMTNPAWLAGYHHGFSDGSAEATVACVSERGGGQQLVRK